MLFEAFLEGPCRRPVDTLKLVVQVCKGGFRLLVGRLPVGTTQLPTPFFAIAFWQVTDDVFPLVPLAALDEAVVADRLPDGPVQATSPVGHEEESLIVGEAPIDEISEEALHRLVMLGGGLHEAKRDLFPIHRHAQGYC